MPRLVLISCVLTLLAGAAPGQDRPVRLHAPEGLIDTGLLNYILPRFSLKTQVRVELTPTPESADLVLGDSGRALFEGAGQVWRLDRRGDHEGAKRLADWLQGEVGRKTVLSFAPGGGDPLFAPPRPAQQIAVEVTYDGDAELGLEVSRVKCGRCHQVEADRPMGGIGSTPSFAVLRSLKDWDARFAGFYLLNPHPSFTVIPDVTDPFPIDRPPPIVPVEMSLDEIDAVLAYVAAMQAADLGAPIRHQ